MEEEDLEVDLVGVHESIRKIFTVYTVHSNSKFRVFATEAFRSEKSTETSDNSTEVSGEINEKF
jgi:hypothetical protein